MKHDAFTPGPETDAIVELRNNHQISTPIEKLTLIEDNSTTMITSDVIYKYRKHGTTKTFARPAEVLGFKGVADASTYPTAAISQTGIFSYANDRVRTVHTFDSYDQSNANLLQQTTLDGTVSAYEWGSGFGASLVTAFTVNPGIQQQKYTYDHYPLIGTKSVTDPNNRTSYYEYDLFSRLKIIKDNDQNVISRYRYHYGGQGTLSSELVIRPFSAPNNTFIFNSPDDAVSGNTRYFWDFGDGTTVETTTGSTSHLYTANGTYTVTLRKVNPEYPTVIIVRTIPFPFPG